MDGVRAFMVPPLARVWQVGLVLAFVSGGAACGSHPDLAAAARLVDVETGWFDAGITEDGKNKLVPSVTLRIQNTSDRPISSTQLNLIFKRVVDEEEFTTAFVRGVGSDGLPPGQTTPPIVVRTQQGYTGEQPRLQMLSNSQFVDFKVEVFGKQGSANWVKLGEFPIARQLLTE